MGLLGTCLPQFLCGNTLTTSLTILRSVSNTQNSYGEVLLSFISVGSVKIDLQPSIGGISRNIHGQIVRAAYWGFVAGNTDIIEFDRALVSNVFIEVFEIHRYGDHSEILWKWVR